MPAQDPGEAVEHFLHDVVVKRLSVQVLLPGLPPVGFRIEFNCVQSLLLRARGKGGEAGEDGGYEVGVQGLQIVNISSLTIGLYK